MASIFENDKGFLILKLSIKEVIMIGGFGICDSCNNASMEGYYVAVLNRWMCPTCFEEWINVATRYNEDIPYEKRNYISMCKTFGLQLL